MDRNDLILVKFRLTEHFISIRTMTQYRESPLSSDLPRAHFADLEVERRIVVKGGYSFAELWLDEAGTKLQIDFTQLFPRGGEATEGFVQTVVLNYGQLALFVRESLEEDGLRTWSVLYPVCSSDHQQDPVHPRAAPQTDALRRAGIPDNDSIYFPGLSRGATVRFEMRGELRPVAYFDGFLSELDRLTPEGKKAVVGMIAARLDGGPAD